jgi:hypothetical protein
MNLREYYQEKVDAQLHEWKEWIDNYRADAAQISGKTAAEQQRLLDKLEACHQAAWLRLQELRQTDEKGWNLAKQAVERALIELKKSLDESGAAQAGTLLSLHPNRSHLDEPFWKRG